MQDISEVKGSEFKLSDTDKIKLLKAFIATDMPPHLLLRMMVAAVVRL